MMRPQILGSLIALLALAGVFHVWQSETLAGNKSDSKVKANATATKPGADGKQTVTITLDIEKEWYIYANPVGSEDFEGNRTSVSFKAKEKVSADVKYPKGKLKTVIIAKEKIEYSTYENRVTLQAQVQRTVGDTSPLKISIDVNACKSGKDGGLGVCLLPATVPLTIP